MASFFALNMAEFPKQDGSTLWHLKDVAKFLCKFRQASYYWERGNNSPESWHIDRIHSAYGGFRLLGYSCDEVDTRFLEEPGPSGTASGKTW